MKSFKEFITERNVHDIVDIAKSLGAKSTDDILSFLNNEDELRKAGIFLTTEIEDTTDYVSNNRQKVNDFLNK